MYTAAGLALSLEEVNLGLIRVHSCRVSFESREGLYEGERIICVHRAVGSRED